MSEPLDKETFKEYINAIGVYLPWFLVMLCLVVALLLIIAIDAHAQWEPLPTQTYQDHLDQRLAIECPEDDVPHLTAEIRPMCTIVTSSDEEEAFIQNKIEDRWRWLESRLNTLRANQLEILKQLKELRYPTFEIPLDDMIPQDFKNYPDFQRLLEEQLECCGSPVCLAHCEETQ